MLVLFAEGADAAAAAAVRRAVGTLGYVAHDVAVPGEALRLAVVANPEVRGKDRAEGLVLRGKLAAMPGVREARAVQAPHVLVGREIKEAPSRIEVDGVFIGGTELVVMAGPCAVEDEAQLFACAAAVSAQGAKFLRGGAFKPRTSPYEFQGLGLQGLRLLAAAGRKHDLRVVTEVVAPEDVAQVAEYAHMLQIGARNMQNFALLKAVGQAGRPVLLKRGLCATYREWLMAGEYVAAHGNPNVVLCERGIRTFETATRNTLDVAAVPVMRSMTHLPIVVDPSHATGRRDAVLAVARAGVAAGADGILVEVHPYPETALSDGPQSLDFAGFAGLMDALRRVGHAVDRTLANGSNHAARPHQ